MMTTDCVFFISNIYIHIPIYMSCTVASFIPYLLLVIYFFMYLFSLTVGSGIASGGAAGWKKRFFLGGGGGGLAVCF
ncbi:hypothetical protein B0T22DRAFT_464537, partial [Podospora appendiculata]